MHLGTTILHGSIVISFIYLLSSIYIFLRHRSKSRVLGCKPPVRRVGADPFGITEVLNVQATFRNQTTPDYFIQAQEAASLKHDRTVGTTTQRMFFRDTLFTSEPKNIQAVLALQFKDFALGVNRTQNFKPLFGEGIFANNGKNWEHSRGLLRPQFIRKQVGDLQLEETHVAVLLKALEREGTDGGEWTKIVDLLPLFFRLTLDTATEFLFGESTNTQQLHLQPWTSEGQQALVFANAFDRSQYILGTTVPLGEFYWLGHTPELKRLVKEVHVWAARYVQIALDYRANPKAFDEKYGEKYIFLHALAKQTQNPDELRQEVLNILLAGRDTTASLLSWFFYLMASKENAGYYQQLRTTILNEFGHDEKIITFERLKSCQYLQWCINESLRLYPVVPVNVRTAVVDTSLPVGGGPDGASPVYVKKGQDVYYSVHAMHRRKDLWGEDADAFKPDRWSGRQHSWSYLPFNGGPRICIGQQFALTETSYVLVRLIQRIEALDGSYLGEVKHNLDLTNCPGDGVKVRLRFAGKT